MSEFYTDVSVLGNNILYRGYEDGRRIQFKYEYDPKLYVKTNKPSEWTNLHGQFVEELHQGTIKDAREFIKRYEDVENFEVYGDIGFDVQYISDKFHSIIDWSIDKMNIYVLDIETISDNGFPDPNVAAEEILLITLTNLKDKSSITFTSTPYTGTKLDPKNIVLCHDEISLIKQFIDYWANCDLDIVVGWNLEGFDIKYLINRINRVLNDDYSKRLSPWNRINERSTKDDYGNSVTYYDIIGINLLDFRDLYKKFTYTKRENYKLDTISRIELGAGKLENPYDTFKEFYQNDFALFTEYNVIDCERIVELEQKMKLIELCLTMSFLAKINFTDVFSQIRMWDAIIFNHLKSKKIVIPPRSKQSKNDKFEGAYVKEPVPGFYNWVTSFDATSLYPSIIQTWNISPETFIGINPSVTVDGLLKGVNYEIGDHTLAANGAKYSKDKLGIMPELVDLYMKKRKDAKSTMLKYESEMEELKSISDYSKSEYKRIQNLISKYNNEQMAFKIAMNSLYGALGNCFFRYYTLENARAVTLSGQYIIISVGNYVDLKLNALFNVNYNWTLYQDTDSIYLSLEPIVDRFLKTNDIKKKITALSKICKEKIDPIINECCTNLQSYTNVYRNCISFKLEAISSRGFWTGKKRYALNVYENEGVIYNEPKLKIMGLEVVKSSTPEVIRNSLKESVSLILNKTEEEIQDYVLDIKSEFKKYSIEQIAFPRSVNGIEKYSDNKTLYASGCPIHTKGSILYNNKLNELKLQNKYEKIYEGDSIKFCYLKTPNPLKDSVIAFPAELPKEFGLHDFVDYDKQYEKTFLDPLVSILDAIGWSYEKKYSIDDFFN